MKVVFLSGVEVAGGGNVAAARLANGLVEQGVEVVRLFNQRVASPFGESKLWQPRYVGLPRALDILNNGLRRLSPVLSKRIGRAYSNHALRREIERTKLDVLHVHVIHNSFWNLSTVERLPRDIPTVWTFHDCWGFSPEAQRFRDLAGNEVRLRPDDASPEHALRARRAYFRSLRHRRLASNSRKVAEMATASLGMEVTPLGCGVDLERFRPIDRTACRRALGIAEHAFVMLFVADNIRDPVKGFEVLERALAGSRLTDSLLLVVGEQECRDYSIGPVRVRQLGRLYNPDFMSIVYCAANVLVMPSLAEAMGLVGMESVACGTPVVGSDVQGIPDVVRPGETGFLVPPGDPSELQHVLQDLRAEPAKASRLSVSCREHAVRSWDYRDNARAYLALYEELLRESRGSAGVAPPRSRAAGPTTPGVTP